MTAHAQPEADTSLTLRRTIAAERPKVFQAWTEPALLGRWFCPRDSRVELTEVDLREGGRYRLGMRDPEGDVHVATGTYLQIVPPQKLVFTWAWEGGEMEGDTQVTVELIDQGDSTEVVLIHQRFPSADMRDKHETGWASCLDHLEQALEAGG